MTMNDDPEQRDFDPEDYRATVRLKGRRKIMNFVDQTIHSVKSALQNFGFAFFENGDYNLNLIGVRSHRTLAGEFDDFLLCAYKVNDLWRLHIWPMTTDPSTHYLKKPINKAGAAILASPQQCRSAYKIGLHHGYPALVQHGAEVKVWRDNNKDNVVNWGEDEGIPGYYGINIHRAKPDNITDDNDYYSAGCQVMPVKEEHDALMDLARRSAAKYKNSFTYTLIDSSDLVV